MSQTEQTGCCGEGENAEEFCRICRQSESNGRLQSACYCKGTMGLIHVPCLQHWLQESGGSNCELCGYEYNMVRVPKYSIMESIWKWMKNPGSVDQARSLWFDIASFIVFTPLAILCTYICVIATRNYTRLDRPLKATLQWTSLAILLFMAAIDVVYAAWVVLRLRYQSGVWYHWYKQKCGVQVVVSDNQLIKSTEVRLEPEEMADDMV